MLSHATHRISRPSRQVDPKANNYLTFVTRYKDARFFETL